MNQTAITTTRAQRNLAAQDLLAHTRQCPNCFHAFAESGKLGSGCGVGKIMRALWVRTVELTKQAEHDAATGACTTCGG